jgi:hypothetical protein
MSSLFKQFKTDTDKEQAGVPIQYGANDDGTIPTFNVRRRGPSNQQYAKALQRETEQYRRQIEMNMLDEMISRQIMLKVFVATILVSWDNVQGEDGKLIPYSKDNAMKLFNALPDLYNDLVEQSGKLSLFRVEVAEQDAKN